MVRLRSSLALLASLGVLVAGCGTVASGSGANPPMASSAGAPVVMRTMTIVTGKMDGRPGWPKFTSPQWSAIKGSTVTLTIVSDDDGTAPLTSNSPFTRVNGTTTGTEWVNGKPVRTVPAQDIAHTFTVPMLGLNLPIPAAPAGGAVTVKATFKVPKSGIFTWQCEAPCGTGASGWAGPMMTPGYMEGAIHVTAQ